jgi:hypothetical protein
LPELLSDGREPAVSRSVCGAVLLVVGGCVVTPVTPVSPASCSADTAAAPSKFVSALLSAEASALVVVTA